MFVPSSLAEERNHEVRNNARVRAVKDALVELLRAAELELSGTTPRAHS